MQLVSTQSVDVPPSASITVSHTISSSPVPQASPWARDSEQVTASEALFMLHEGPRTSQSSTMPDTIPETQDISQEDYKVIIPRRSSGLDTRPYPILVDPNATTPSSLYSQLPWMSHLEFVVPWVPSLSLL